MNDFFGLVAGLAFMLACVLVSLLFERTSLKRRLKDADESLSRYRQAVDDVDKWCGHEFPEARILAGHIDAEGEGKPMNAGSPALFEVCDINGTREQLRRLKKSRQKEVS